MKRDKTMAYVWWAIIIGLGLFWVIVGLLVVKSADADPWLVCYRPETGTDPAYWHVDGLPWLEGVDYNAEPDLSMRVDLFGTPVGELFSARCRACDIWDQCGEWSDPLNFTRPAESSCGKPNAPIIME